MPTSKPLEKLQRYLEEDFEESILNHSDSAHDFGHIQRVWRLCRKIAEKESPVLQTDLEGANLNVLLLAAYFHDSVNYPKDHPKRGQASTEAAQKALKYIEEHKLPLSDQQKENVFHSIQVHSYSANLIPKTLEAKILQDADRLEALGAIGIARVFSVSGALSRPLFHPEDPLGERRALDDKKYAVDHFYMKLFKIAETLQTEAAKEIARHRVEVMKKFLKTLKKEALL